MEEILYLLLASLFGGLTALCKIQGRCLLSRLRFIISSTALTVSGAHACFVRTWYCICPMAGAGVLHPTLLSVNIHPIPFILIPQIYHGRE